MAENGHAAVPDLERSPQPVERRLEGGPILRRDQLGEDSANEPAMRERRDDFVLSLRQQPSRAIAQRRERLVDLPLVQAIIDRGWPIWKGEPSRFDRPRTRRGEDAIRTNGVIKAGAESLRLKLPSL